MAYTMAKRLQLLNRNDILKRLQNNLTEREKRKGQLHKVFKDSFDAKAIFSERFLLQKLQYIHHNPVRSKWNLAEDFTRYEHSSASFYEKGRATHFIPKNFADL